MSRDGFRFSHDKRFFRKVSYADFAETLSGLCKLVLTAQPGANIEVLTCEDPTTYDFSTVTFASDEVGAALEKRKHYRLEQFSQEVWKRSYDIQLTIRDKSDTNPFMICLSCDRTADSRRLMFYGQCVGEHLSDAVRASFAKPNFWHGIGDGFSRSSKFNFAFGQRLTGIRLA